VARLELHGDELSKVDFLALHFFHVISAEEICHDHTHLGPCEAEVLGQPFPANEGIVERYSLLSNA